MVHSLLRKSFFVFFVSAAIHIFAQTSNTDHPRLVIGIMVDGLQQKHIDILWNYFDSNGLRKIVEQGATCENINYNIISGGNASDIASVMTGSVPYYNGVSANLFYDKETGNETSIILDEKQIGIGTNQTFSAHYLLSSTVLDELALAYPKKSKCYAIAINPEDAIMLGGHTANSVAWIDDSKLQWVTTGYYPEGLSRGADEMNATGTFTQMITKPWEPYFTINTYLTPPSNEDKRVGFHYDPTTKKSKNSSQTIAKTTPAANKVVAELAIRTINQELLGTDKYPDMLMLQFTVRTPFEKTFAMQSAEKEDIYLRLDKDIQNILQEVDRKVGLDKTLVFLFTNQTAVHSPRELGDNKIPAGYFNANRSLALLSTYLMAIYGQQKWINGYYGKNIYLNKRLVEEKKINFREFQQTVAEFMTEFAGIQAAYTSFQLANTDLSEKSISTRIRNSNHKSMEGDVTITLMPGWLEVDDRGNPIGDTNAIQSYTPVYFYGWKIPVKKVSENYNTTDIAPTISKMLNIPLPNACVGKPIEGLFQK